MCVLEGGGAGGYGAQTAAAASLFPAMAMLSLVAALVLLLLLSPPCRCASPGSLECLGVWSGSSCQAWAWQGGHPGQGVAQQAAAC